MSVASKASAPSAQCKGLTFLPIPAFDAPTVAFGADEKHYFNRRDLPDVPRQYQDMAAKLFYSGGKLPAFADDVDVTLAARATRAWLASFAPSHESKMATVGYAFWLWTTPAAERAS